MWENEGYQSGTLKLLLPSISSFLILLKRGDALWWRSSVLKVVVFNLALCSVCNWPSDAGGSQEWGGGARTASLLMLLNLWRQLSGGLPGFQPGT